MSAADPRPTRTQAERSLAGIASDYSALVVDRVIATLDRAGFIRPEPRAPGFYYVRHRSFDWTIRHWHNERWWHGGDAADEPAEIGDRIPMPDEPPQERGS